MEGIQHSQLAPLPKQVPFRIVSRTIGSGAYACIKKAAPLKSDNPVFAVKFINKRYALKYGKIKQKQLQMETSLHKHVGLHKNIIEFYDTGEDPEWTWIAMELAEGGDLFDKIEADAGVSEDIAHVYFTQLVNAIGYMHSRGVGHRDIKPENILLSADGDLKLADFGMATLFEYGGKRKLAVTLCGSPPYVAPEVLSCSSQGTVKGSGYSADLSDIWSCGVVLFVLLAGNTPWNKPVEGKDEYGRPNEYSEYVESNGRPTDELWQQLPSDVLSLLRGMMKVDVKSRFTLEDVRRHPWFTRSNRYMDSRGRLMDPVSMATNMFERLHVSFDADPFRSTQRSSQDDAMDIDRPLSAIQNFPATQPDTPAEDMLFDWERPHINNLSLQSSTQPIASIPKNFSATQPASHTSYRNNNNGFHHQHIQLSQSATTWLTEEPSLSQFTSNPAVPISRTQLARRFHDILPPTPSSLTKFYSVWSLSLLVPVILEALTRLGVPTTKNVPISGSGSEATVKIRTTDGRGCPLSGAVNAEVVGEGLVEISFVKASGDPLEWRRLFKKVVVLCRDAVYKPEE